MNSGTGTDESQIAANLVRQIEAGAAEAENELIRRYSNGLMLMLRSRTGNLALSEDLHQETFFIVLQKIRTRQVGEPQKLAGYIHQVAKNLAIANFRKEGRHQAKANQGHLHEQPASEAPLEQLQRQQEAKMVRQIIAELPQERDRHILFRFYVAEEEKQKILTDLNLDTLHFNRVLFRARQRFKTLWQKTCENLAPLKPPGSS